MINPHLHELVASRICHDLISPIGACANGAELLSMGGGEEEAALISDSAANASGRVRFFRIAFGQSSASNSVPKQEVKDALQAIASDRLLFDWQIDGDVSRKETQAVFLAVLCLERAMPRGGAVIIKKIDDKWSLSAESSNLLITEALWTPLSQSRSPDEIIPATVSFALLPEALGHLSRHISINMTETRILMQF
ncbi:histidine phosphotransferase family protein [Cognatishimia activa]|uniref:histidine phosphotransferase family protein n=1 Tax=Cognatishimia activa TaxID=1715691 RepID=UPI00223179CD|nr:histidine phosphotransferase family protein [Cognatishimia activa]UZD92053.1 histidine phosphotransferase family protein [Cognatishimia activa]